jgi:hypothetical protein
VLTTNPKPRGAEKEPQVTQPSGIQIDLNIEKPLKGMVLQFSYFETALRTLNASMPIQRAIGQDVRLPGDFRITIRGLPSGERDIVLPAKFSLALERYLRDVPRHQIEGRYLGSDCVDFVYCMNGDRSNSGFDSRNIGDNSVDVANLNPGDSVAFFSDNGLRHRRVSHCGIYLGEGLFLSKLGGQPLYVTSTASLVKGYHAPHLFLMRIAETGTTNGSCGENTADEWSKLKG